MSGFILEFKQGHLSMTKGGEARSQVVKAAAECVTRRPPLGKDEPSVSPWKRRSCGKHAWQKPDRCCIGFFCSRGWFVGCVGYSSVGGRYSWQSKVMKGRKWWVYYPSKWIDFCRHDFCLVVVTQQGDSELKPLTIANKPWKYPQSMHKLWCLRTTKTQPKHHTQISLYFEALQKHASMQKKNCYSLNCNISISIHATNVYLRAYACSTHTMISWRSPFQ